MPSFCEQHEPSFRDVDKAMTVATNHPLQSFFWPQSVAVIGASPDQGKIRGRLLAFLQANAYQGHILPINPSHQQVNDIPCYASIAEASEHLKQPVDLVLLAIPANAVLPELERCASAKVKNVIIITAGFAEEGGESAYVQEQIAELSKRSGMRISGPNAEGFYNAMLNLAATFSPTLATPPVATPRISNKRIGIVAQSGGIGYALFQQGYKMGLNFSYVMTSGNEADIDMAELLEYMVADTHSQVIFLYVESIRDTARFMQASLKARVLGKSIIVVKIGQSASGQRAAASHTAAMAGWNTAYSALFERCGIYQALDLEEALNMACLLVTGPAPTGKRVAIVSASGGAAAWAGDTIERLGGSVPVLSDTTQAAIRKYIPSYGEPQNPIDITAQALRTGGMLCIVDYLMDSDEVDSILVVTSLTIKHFFLDTDELQRLASTGRKPFMFYSFSIPTELAIHSLAATGIAASTNLPGICAAMLKLAQTPPLGYLERTAPPSLPNKVAKIIEQADFLLCEYEVKALIKAYGVEASSEHLAKNEDEAVAAAELLGYPVAMKIQSPLLPHKSEIGGVQLQLNSVEQVRQAYRELNAAGLANTDPKQLRGILVQAMADKGHELIIGTVRDPSVGPLVLVGFGGIAVELYRDVTYRLAPIDQDGGLEMLESLKSSVLLKGFRGQAGVDLTPIAALIAKVSQIAWQLQDVIDEFELNPVIVSADSGKLTIADALMRKRNPV
jgi:acyl-CoA synthetase (NDP forming)